jgi:hypothetical protein
MDFSFDSSARYSTKVAMLRASSVRQSIVSSRDVSFGKCKPATIEQICLLVEAAAAAH